MDTQNISVAPVPNFKLAKVGAERERKRGGFAWLGTRGLNSAFSVAAEGGAASWMAMARLVLPLILACGVSAGAWHVGVMNSGKLAAAEKPEAKKVFEDKGPVKYADTSNVIKSENTLPNSLGYVSGSTDGLTPEERAKKAAADAAAAKAADEAKAKADAEAQKKADEDASKAPQMGDPSAMTAGGAANAGNKGLGGSRFGAMKSSFGGGGGLSGGSGLSGGINGNFGGMNGFAPKNHGGALAAFRTPSNAASSAVGHRAAGKSNAKGFARQQLDGAAGASRAATGASKSESAMTGAAAPFDNNQTGGSVISGPGVGAGTRGGAADSSPNSTTGGGGGGSGPLNTGAPACTQTGYEPDINGNCRPIVTPTTQNAAPYQWMIDLVKKLMLATLILTTLLLALVAYALATLPIGAGLLAFIQTIRIAIIAIGALVALLGIAIVGASGDVMMGGIIAVCGALVATAAIVPGAFSVVGGGGVAILVASAGGYLASAHMRSGQMD